MLRRISIASFAATQPLIPSFIYTAPPYEPRRVSFVSFRLTVLDPKELDSPVIDIPNSFCSSVHSPRKSLDIMHPDAL